MTLLALIITYHIPGVYKEGTSVIDLDKSVGEGLGRALVSTLQNPVRKTKKNISVDTLFQPQTLPSS